MAGLAVQVDCLHELGPGFGGVFLLQVRLRGEAQRVGADHDVAELVGDLLGLLQVLNRPSRDRRGGCTSRRGWSTRAARRVAVAGLLRDLVGLEEERERAAGRRADPARRCRGCSAKRHADQVADLPADFRSACSNASSASLNCPESWIDEAEVVERERDGAPVAELARRTVSDALRGLEGASDSRRGASELADVVDGRWRCRARRWTPRTATEARPRDASARRRGGPCREEAADAGVRGAALRLEVEPVRADQHLVEGVERLVVLAEDLEHVAVVVERAPAAARSSPPRRRAGCVRPSTELAALPFA